jgi:hypothetical protein
MANKKIAGFGDLNFFKKIILNEITVHCVIAIYIKGSCKILLVHFVLEQKLGDKWGI